MSKNNYKKGDKLALKKKQSTSCGCDTSELEYIIIDNVVTSADGGVNYEYSAFNAKGFKFHNCSSCFKTEMLVRYKNNQFTNMNLTDRMAVVFKGEPQKSFIKAGILDSSEIPTDDGVKLIIAYIIKNDVNSIAASFKKDIVDVILAEQEKE